MKADMGCPRCGYHWEYSGMDTKSCWCPRCNNKVEIPEFGVHFVLHGRELTERKLRLKNEAAE